MTRVFISHSSKDDDFVTHLADKLQGAQINTWVDHRDISPGEDWDDAVETALDTCDAMIPVLSLNSVKSKNVKVEWSYFLDLEKSIYPVILENCRVPFRLRLHQQVDFSKGETDAVANLIRVLGSADPSERSESPSFSTTHDSSADVREAVAASPGKIDVPVLDISLEPEIVVVPEGKFRMGSDKTYDAQAFDEELPQHSLFLPSYGISKYPITVENFRAFVEAAGYEKQKYWTASGWQWQRKSNRQAPRLWNDTTWNAEDSFPIVAVSWYEAVAYCGWLSETTGKTYRLPTEAEWEKAARGLEGQIYPWGNTWLEGVCNTKKAGIGHITPVDRYSPAGDSPFGVSDMIGNVWEWCQTKWRNDYNQSPDEDLEGKSERCTRGGSWSTITRLARAAARSQNKPNTQDSGVGFRVVCVV